MTDLMQIICEHFLDDGCKDFLPQEYYRNYFPRMEKKESALSETLTEAQRELFDAYQMAAGKVQLLELEAMFQAAWAAARELA